MSSSRWLAVLAFIAILAVGVAACGGSDSSSGGSETASSETESGGEEGGASAEVSGEIAGP